MKRIIITPTFRPHFPFNREFLQSYQDHVADAADFPVHFIVARDDLADMQTMLRAFPALDVHAHTFEDILRASGHEDAPLAILEELGKFSFQSLKKLYALKALPYDQALVLDSECLVLKPTRLADVFDSYFAAPYVLYSDLAHRGEFWVGGLSDAATQNAGKLLGVPYPGVYYMEYYGWFYEKRVVTDLFAAFPEDLLPAVRGRLGQDKRIFENVLYYHFLRDHPEGTRYRFASVNVMLRRYLGAEEYAEYMRQFAGPLEQIGVFEYVSKAVTEQNLPALIRLFREEDFRFYRFELLNRNERLQQTLIDETPITFLVSSENYRRTRERVAVCLSGEARHYRQNVKFIRNFLAGSEVDVFFHFWESPDQHFIADALAPKAYLFEPRTAVPEPPPRARPEKFISPDRDRNVMSALYSMRRANGLKQAYEEEQGFRYDVVVRLRLDVFTTQTLMELLDRIRLEQGGWERTVYVPDMAHSIGINDQVVLGSSEAMDVFMSVIDEVESIAATELFNPEYFLLRHILRAGLRIRTVPFEYVLLRNADVSTFDLEDHVHRTRTTWWSAQLPEIPHRALNDFFGAKADSVLLIDELGLETPKTFRLRSASHGYLSLERASGRLAFTPHLVEASTFFLIIAGGEDRTAVDVRCRDLVLDEHGALRPEHDRANLYPDAQGTLLADGPSDPYSAFFLARAGEGVTLEWRAGFWRTPDESRREAPREPGGRTLRYHEGYRGGRRLFVHASASGLSLAVAEEGAEPFLVEYVADPAAEASRLGVQQSLNTTPADSDPLVLRLLWRSYVAARIVEQRGASGLMRQATQFMRRHAFLAARDNGTRGGGGGIVTRAMRFVRERL